MIGGVFRKPTEIAGGRGAKEVARGGLTLKPFLRKLLEITGAPKMKSVEDEVQTHLCCLLNTFAPLAASCITPSLIGGQAIPDVWRKWGDPLEVSSGEVWNSLIKYSIWWFRSSLCCTHLHWLSVTLSHIWSNLIGGFQLDNFSEIKIRGNGRLQPSVLFVHSLDLQPTRKSEILKSYGRGF